MTSSSTGNLCRRAVFSWHGYTHAADTAHYTGKLAPVALCVNIANSAEVSNSGLVSMRLSAIFGRRQGASQASDLYLAIVAQARQSGFYEVLGVPDTLDGRFEMIVVHAVMVMRGLRSAGSEGKAIAQSLFDEMFADMDRSLRELGVGDLGVGRRVKSMASAFYGRAEAYEKGLDGPEGVLEDAITRNLYGTASPAAQQAADMASYVRREVAALSKLDGTDLLEGRVRFGAPPCLDVSH